VRAASLCFGRGFSVYGGWMLTFIRMILVVPDNYGM